MKYALLALIVLALVIPTTASASVGNLPLVQGYVDWWTTGGWAQAPLSPTALSGLTSGGAALHGQSDWWAPGDFELALVPVRIELAFDATGLALGPDGQPTYLHCISNFSTFESYSSASGGLANSWGGGWVFSKGSGHPQSATPPGLLYGFGDRDTSASPWDDSSVVSASHPWHDVVGADGRLWLTFGETLVVQSDPFEAPQSGYDWLTVDQVKVLAIMAPEPSSFVALATGLVGLMAFIRRRK